MNLFTVNRGIDGQSRAIIAPGLTDMQCMHLAALLRRVADDLVNDTPPEVRDEYARIAANLGPITATAGEQQ